MTERQSIVLVHQKSRALALYILAELFLVINQFLFVFPIRPIVNFCARFGNYFLRLDFQIEIDGLFVKVHNTQTHNHNDKQKRKYACQRYPQFLFR